MRRTGPSVRGVFVSLGAAMVFGAGQDAMAQCAAWRLDPYSPGERNQHAMAYDAARGVTVLFGGFTGGRTGGTWEYDGTAWTRRVVPPQSGPSPRIQAGMVFDSARNVCVLYGGDVGAASAETWEWDGEAWTQRPVQGPPGRYRHGMVYDAARQRTVVFGGFDGVGRNNETWEFDGTEWILRTDVGGPAPRSTPAMAYDAARDVTVLFGGFTGGSYFDETWEYDGTAWTQRTPASGPSARTLASAAFDPVRGVVVLFGGSDGVGEFAETWEWDGAAWAERPTGPVTGRESTALVYDLARGVTVMVGGSNGPALLGDTLEWDGAEWTPRAFPGPGARVGSALAYDAARGGLVLFGGDSAGTGAALLGDTWARTASGWAAVGSGGPSARWRHAVAYDAVHGETVLFGGATSEGLSDETWVWNGEAWSRRETPGPSARAGHAMAFDAGRAAVVLFGGDLNADGTLQSDEMWEWDGAAWTLRTAAGPAARAGHSMAYDPARQRTVLFGGLTGAVLSGETWEWDGTGDGAWVLLAPETAPPARSRAAMAYAAARGAVELVGGLTASGRSNQVWDWNGETWSQRPADGPAARAGHGAAYDPSRGALVLFGGGTGAGVSGETWEFLGSTAPAILQQPTAQSGCEGASATLSVAAEGVGSLSYQWRRNGVSLTDGGAIGGATTPTLTIAALAPADAGSYDVVVTGTCGTATSDSAAVTVTAGAEITEQPEDAAVLSGQAASFIVVAGGGGEGGLTYRWRRDGTPLEDGPRITGSATATLTIDPVEVGDEGEYTVVVGAAPCGSATSAPAGLTVQAGCSADYDGNGEIQPADISLLVVTWFSDLQNGTMVADIDGNGAVEPGDISFFVARWFNQLVNGC